MTAPDTDYDGPAVCRRCGGPCWQWKGSVHGWTCQACIDRYLDEGAAKGAVRDRRDRERQGRKAFYNDTPAPVTANGRRRDGGDRVMYRPPVPASARQPEGAAEPSYVPR